jgi:phage-related protein
VIVVADACRRELRKLPASIRADLADALARLDEGLTLSMPLSRPMSDIGPGVHELRLKDRSGVYRVIYAVVIAGTIGVLHAFKKTTRTTPKANLILARMRLKELKS